MVRCAPQPHWQVLDAGTGTGHTALSLAPAVRFVAAIDLTPEMIAEATKLGCERGVKNVGFGLADVAQMPFPDRCFELITCRRAAHHFLDIRRALKEMARVLRPAGRLVVDDRSVPEEDTVDRLMNEFDRLHDSVPCAAVSSLRVAFTARGDRLRGPHRGDVH